MQRRTLPNARTFSGKTPLRRLRRRWWWTAGGLLIVVTGMVTWLLWPSPTPRERRYRDVTACLLTGERGVSSSEAAPVWAGMQDASRSTLAKVQYLEVDGPQVTDNAATYLASLIQSKCELVLAVGEAQVDAVEKNASRFPAARFVVVGAGTARPNVSVVDVDSPEVVRSTVSRVVEAAVGAPTGR